MDVAELIRKLEKLDPAARVLLPGDGAFDWNDVGYVLADFAVPGDSPGGWRLLKHRDDRVPAVCIVPVLPENRKED